MAWVTSVNSRSRFRGFLGAPFRRQTYRNLLYLGLAFPLGIAYVVVVVVGLALGVGLSIVVVGIPILATLVVVGTLLAGWERWLATRLLGHEFETRSTLEGDSSREKLVSAVTDLRTYTPLVYLPAKFVFGVLTVVVVFTTLTTGISLVFAPLYFGEPGVYVGVITDRPVEIHPAIYVGWNKLLIGFETVLSLDYWRIQTLPQSLVVSVVGVGITLLGLNVVNGLARLAGWLTQLLLDDGYSLVETLTADQN